MENEKQIRWVGFSYHDLLAFPKAARKEAGFQLGKVQAGLDPEDWKPFDEVGAGTREIRILEESGALRVSGDARAKGCEMKIDTEIRRMTKPGANLFLDLGFTPEEAKRLHAASRKQINDTRALKRQLMQELSVWIASHKLKQADAAEILMVSRPRVSDVVNKKTAKFTIDSLVEMLSRIGKPVRLAVSSST